MTEGNDTQTTGRGSWLERNADSWVLPQTHRIQILGSGAQCQLLEAL